MKHIGFVDYYLSEWHANNYPVWIKEMNEKLGTDYVVSYGWAEKDISPVDGVSTDEWCEKMGITRCASIAELCEKSDVIILLAPSDPQKHLGYAKELLPFGKPTYIDKTFAPDLKTAEEIFSIAKQHGTPFFSTSALRYADELADFKDARDMIITGGGSNFEEYAIHLVEMVIVLAKEAITQVKVECQGVQRFCHLKLESGETMMLLFAPGMPYTITAFNQDGTDIHKDVTSDFFQKLMIDILNFFESKKLPFDGQQTLDVMRLRDALLKAQNQSGEWIAI